MTSRPSTIWAAFGLIIASLVMLTVRTIQAYQQLTLTEDAVRLSAIEAALVWCNVLIWIALALPMSGVLAGWRSCRSLIVMVDIVAIIGMVMMHGSEHSLSFSAYLIIGAQITAALLLFTPPSTAFFLRAGEARVKA